jgi:micrococcal nuclease
MSHRAILHRAISHRARRLIVNLAQTAVLFGLAACSDDAVDHTVNHDQVAVLENTVLEAAVPENTAPENTVQDATVLEVVDGDTLRLDLDGSRESVRLIGVNTPETKHPTKGVECFGPEASAFLARWLQPGTRVRVERDLEARDAYRRLLLYVFVDTSSGQRFVNLELVARGFATPLSIEPNTRYQQFFVDAAFDAQRHSRGMWGACP